MKKFPSSPRSLITGAASGFGRAVALELSSRKARLVLSDVKEEGLEETASLARQRGADVRTLRCDVRDAAQVEAQAALAEEAFGGIDIGINNAGVAVAGPVGDISLEDWKWQLDINLWGVIHGCHSLAPRLKAQGFGWIMNVASSAGLLAMPTMGPYNVSKAGVISLSETMAGELVGTGVSVSALCPTFFRTNLATEARTCTPEMREQTARLVTDAKWSAEQVAKIALDQLEKGQLYIIPQADGRGMWRIKRALGGRFHKALGHLMNNPRFTRLAGLD